MTDYRKERLLMTSRLYASGAAYEYVVRDVLHDAAQLIAEYGWCQGLPYSGRPTDPQAVALVAALRWAGTGDAETEGPRSVRALTVLRERLDPSGETGLSDSELLTAWNDAPSRTRDSVVGLLLGAAAASRRSHDYRPTVGVPAPVLVPALV